MKCDWWNTVYHRRGFPWRGNHVVWWLLFWCAWIGTVGLFNTNKTVSFASLDLQFAWISPPTYIPKHNVGHWVISWHSLISVTACLNHTLVWAPCGLLLDPSAPAGSWGRCRDWFRVQFPHDNHEELMESLGLIPNAQPSPNRSGGRSIIVVNIFPSFYGFAFSRKSGAQWPFFISIKKEISSNCGRHIIYLLT